MQQNKPKRKINSTLKWIGWVLLVQFVLINVTAAFYAYKLTHFYESPTQPQTQSNNFFSKTWTLFTGPKFYKLPSSVLPTVPYQTIYFNSSNGEKIESWFLPKKDSSKGTVILLHGLSINKSVLLQEAYAFLDMGYNTLLLDFRGHGNSSGNTTTFGHKETEEVKLAYDYVANKGEKNIILYGLSMGAAIAAKAIYDYPIHPSKLILEAPFESLKTHLKGRARTLGFPPEPFATLVTFWIGLERGFNGFKLNVCKYAGKINCPVLLQYGEEDKLVTADETKNIFDHLSSKEKKLAVHSNTGHELFILKDPYKWKEEVSGFLNGQ